MYYLICRNQKNYSKTKVKALDKLGLELDYGCIKSKSLSGIDTDRT